jgi:hypothetical protein
MLKRHLLDLHANLALSVFLHLSIGSCAVVWITEKLVDVRSSSLACGSRISDGLDIYVNEYTVLVEGLWLTGGSGSTLLFS